jgi:hypothetical protein
MLKHFGSGSDNDALLGDLDEQYAEKNSALWYWRQTLGAIVVSFFKEIWGHKWIAGRGLLTGWAVWMIFLTMIPLHVPMGFFFSHRYFGELVVNDTALPLLVGMLCGWLVALLHRKQGTAVVLLFATSFILLNPPLLWKIVVHPVVMGVLPSMYAQIASRVVAAFFGILLGGGLLLKSSNNAAPAE